MAITIEDIQKKSFTTRPRGCDRFEVDSFLEDIMLQMQTTETELNELRQKCSALYDTINTYKKTEDSMKELLVLAKERKDDIIAKAEEEAAEIVNAARERAEEMSNGLEAHVEALRAEAEAMKAEYINYRTKLEDMLKAQLASLGMSESGTVSTSPFAEINPKADI